MAELCFKLRLLVSRFSGPGMPSSSGSSSSSSSSSSESEAGDDVVEALEQVVERAPSPPPAAPVWLTKEDDTARSMVFLITFAAVLDETALLAEAPLKTLEGMTREDVRDAILDAVANPAQDQNQRAGRPRTKKLEALKLVVFLELPLHFHVALKLDGLARFLPLKWALRLRAGLSSHWSTTHTQWYSPVRYGVFTTEHKAVVDLAPLVWTQAGGTLEAVKDGPGPHHRFKADNGGILSLYEESQEPFNASALRKRREKTEAAAVGEAEATGKKPKVAKFNQLDFTALVLDKGLPTPNAVLAYAQDFGSQTCQLFCKRNQKTLAELIAEATEWRDAKKNYALEQETDWALIQRLAGGTCTCAGPCQWADAAGDFFHRQRATIDHQLLAASLANVITNGPSKTARVPMIVGATNACKSTILDPVDNVFGMAAVAHCPALGASMPLASLGTRAKRFIYWDEYLWFA